MAGATTRILVHGRRRSFPTLVQRLPANDAHADRVLRTRHKQPRAVFEQIGHGPAEPPIGRAARSHVQTSTM